MLKAGIIVCLAGAAALFLASSVAGVQEPSSATTGASSALPAKAMGSSFQELHGNAHLENLPLVMH
jgi:hypothetical protein